jgi:ATP-dependent 26S proteasome regulatory subunit
VVIIAACNDATMVDPALVRAGRLDHRFQMGLPAQTSIEAILRVHLRHALRDEPLADIAAIAHGMSGAELEAAVRAARKAARLCGRPMRRGDLLVAISEARGIELTATAAMVH